ncbi:hypothetical protein K438DRAFT_2022839 [Mycena galopus ATCC 62051]|nr:hypothetical protein K438DRAFT_2022839 [Mycena galopus ATCC 62051]
MCYELAAVKNSRKTNTKHGRDYDDLTSAVIHDLESGSGRSSVSCPHAFYLQDLYCTPKRLSVQEWNVGQERGYYAYSTIFFKMRRWTIFFAAIPLLRLRHALSRITTIFGTDVDDNAVTTTSDQMTPNHDARLSAQRLLLLLVICWVEERRRQRVYDGRRQPPKPAYDDLELDRGYIRGRSWVGRDREASLRFVKLYRTASGLDDPSTTAATSELSWHD